MHRFQREKAKKDREYHITPQQKSWAQAVIQAIACAPPDNGFHGQTGVRLLLLKIVTTTAFEMSVLLVIIANVVQLGLAYFDMDESHKEVHDLMSLVLTGVFTLEAVLKIGGMGFSRYAPNANSNTNQLH